MLEQKASHQDVDGVQSFGCGTRFFQGQLQHGLGGGVVDRAVTVVDIDLHDDVEAVKEFQFCRRGVYRLAQMT